MPFRESRGSPQCEGGFVCVCVQNELCKSSSLTPIHHAVRVLECVKSHSLFQSFLCKAKNLGTKQTVFK